MNKVFDRPLEAVADIRSGSSIAVGGFGTCGVPQTLIEAVCELGPDRLRVVSNNCGLEGWGLGLLLVKGRIERMTSSYVGENADFEQAISCDFALVRAAKSDTYGNLVFSKSARNFNPVCAMAGRTTIAEVEELVGPGAIDPDQVHLPGIFVQRIVRVPDPSDKVIERRKVRSRSVATAGPAGTE
jgi:acyl CoA:acetate/3-ketoacid CoA transferase alpha subunit